MRALPPTGVMRRGKPLEAETRPARVCALPGCETPLTRKQRAYCCWEHYAETALAAAGRAGNDAVSRAARRPPRPRPAPEPAEVRNAPWPITELMWRLAAAGEPLSGCLCAGLTPEQAARVQDLQRRRAAA